MMNGLWIEWGRWALLRKAKAYDVGVSYFGGMTAFTA